MEAIDCSDELIQGVLGAAITVHKSLGPGLVESIYEKALMYELNAVGISARNQVGVPVEYGGQILDIAFRVDILVEKRLVLELKSVDQMTPLHVSQLVTYLKLMHIRRGFLINFNVCRLKFGIKKISV